MFFLFNPFEAGMLENQKDTYAEEIQKSASMEFHKWRKNMVNVENCNFLKVNWEFLSLI